VCDYFNLHPTTTHMAIAYLDRLQPNEKFSRFEWQMLAISCILIASKYNECEDHVPDLATLEDITQQSISNSTLLNFELFVLKRMGWKLNARMPITFLSCHMVYNHGLVKTDDVLITTSSGDVEDEESSRADVQKKVHAQANAAATACLLNIEYKRFLASDIATAIVHLVRERLGELRSTVWSDAIQTDIGSVDRPEVQEVLQKLRSQQTQVAGSSSSSGSGFGDKLQGQGKQAMSPQAVDAASPMGSGAGLSKYNQSTDEDKENVYGDTMNRLTQSSAPPPSQAQQYYGGSAAAPISQF